MLSLVMNPSTPDERTFTVGVGVSTIGRTRDNHVVCVHKSLSRRHAQVDYDGKTITVADLQSKNGTFFNGKRVQSCQVSEGDSFRCGDVTFLVESATARIPRVSLGVPTLPSAASGASAAGRAGVTGGGAPASKRGGKAPRPTLPDEEHPYKDKLFLFLRASELLVGQEPLVEVLDELLVLAVRVLDADRIALLTLDEKTLELQPKVIKAFAGAAPRPYSKRVVDWVLDKSSPAAFADVSRDQTLPGDIREDAAIKGAVAAPINPGSGAIGVLYADSVSKVDAFQPDDLALFRALANIAAIAMESHALRRSERGASSARSSR